MIAIRSRNISTHGGGKSKRWGKDKEERQKENVWTRDQDLVGKLKAQERERNTWSSTFFLAYGSLGVIYGDIGTSIIYVFGQIFVNTDLTQSADVTVDIYGAVSLIFWTLTLIALFKYVFVVLRANDTGEGGTVALYAQLCRTMGFSPFGTMRTEDHKQVLALRSAGGKMYARPTLGEHRHRAPQAAAPKQAAKTKRPVILPYEPYFGFLCLEPWYINSLFRRNRWAQRSLMVFTMIATGLVIGDGILMPAFSVNSAIAGIDQHGGEAIDNGAIVGITIAVIVVLFLTQHFGTQKLAYLFTPIIILWLTANLAIAIYNLRTYGGAVFQGLSPYWIYRFFLKYGGRQAWIMLSGVMLCVAGVETMFAAMGHFSQPAVAIAFGLFAYPCLMIAYLGQGAYLIAHPQDAQNAYFASVPEPVFWPMLVLATLAAIVASQAVITGTFSIIRQATSLGVFPRLRIVHTDSFVEGQIFIPVINYTLMVLCIVVVAGFGGDAVRLGDAYGVAVMAVMLITTVLVTLIMIAKWRASLLICIPFLFFFVFIEGVFLGSTMYKVPSGGWFPIAVSFVVVIIMCVWWAGQYARRRLMVKNAKETNTANFIKLWSGHSEDDLPFPGADRALAALGSPYGDANDSANGSAVDLAGLQPMYAAGYAQYEAMDDHIMLGERNTGQSDVADMPPAPAPRPRLGRMSQTAAPPRSGPTGGGSGGGGGKRIPALFRASASPGVTLRGQAPRTGAEAPAARAVGEALEPVEGGGEGGEGGEGGGGGCIELLEVSEGLQAFWRAVAAGAELRSDGVGGGDGGDTFEDEGALEAYWRAASQRADARAGRRGVAEGVEIEADGDGGSGDGGSSGIGRPPRISVSSLDVATGVAGGSGAPVGEASERNVHANFHRGSSDSGSPARVAAAAPVGGAAARSPSSADLPGSGAPRSPAHVRVQFAQHDVSPLRRTAAENASRRSSFIEAVPPGGGVAAAAVAGGGGTPGDGAAPASMVRAVKFAVADGDDGGDDAPGGSGGPTASRSASAASASGPYGSPHRRGQLKRCKSSLALAHRPEHKLAHLGGVGIFYSDSPTGLPPIMMHFLHNIDAMHEVVIILTVRFLPLPNIAPVERFLVRSIEQLPNFYQVVARYGYQDQIDHGPGFVSNVIATIMHKLELKAGLQYAGLENDYIHELEGGDEEAGQEEPDDADADEEAQTAASAAAAAASMAAALAPPDMYACSSPGGSSHAPSFLSAHQSPYVSKFTLNALERIRVQANADDSPQAVQEALMMAEALVDTVCERVVYYQGRSFTRAKRGTGPVHQLVVGTLYRSLEMIAYNDSEAWSIPLENMVELGIILEI